MKAARENRGGLSREKFIKKYDFGYGQYRDWEQGKTSPSLADLTKLRGILGADFLAEHFEISWERPIHIHTLSRRKPVIEEGGIEVVEIPLIEDEAAAGPPSEINENHIKEWLPIPKSLARKGPEAYCAVSVRGDSMVPILHPGDIVCIDTQSYEIGKLKGKLVGANVPDEGSVVKRLDRISTTTFFKLLSENAEENEPIEIRNPKPRVLVGEVIWFISTKL